MLADAALVDRDLTIGEKCRKAQSPPRREVRQKACARGKRSDIDSGDLIGPYRNPEAVERAAILRMALPAGKRFFG